MVDASSHDAPTQTERSRETRLRFDALLGFVPSIVVGCQADGTIVYVGGALTGGLGYEVSDVLGRHFSEFVHDNTIERAFEGISRWQGRTGAPIGSIVPLQHADGTYRQFHFASRFGDDLFGTDSFVVTLTPTEINSSVNEMVDGLIANEERVTRIASTFLDVAADNFEDGINAALNELTGLNAVTRISIWTVDGDAIALNASWEAPVGAPTIELPAELRVDISGMARSLIAGSEFRLTIPGAIDPDYALEYEAFLSGGVHSVLAVPMMSRGRVLGILGLESTLSDVRFDITHVTSIRSAGAIIAAALDRQQTEAELARQARTDPTTGLANRWHANGELQRLLDLVKSGEMQGIGVAMVDLDRFKLVNEALGHHAGDQLLQEVASRFAGAARPLTELARLSADDFFVMVPDASSIDELVSQVHALLGTLTAPFGLGDATTSITATAGLIHVGSERENAPNGEEILRRLETTLDRAKEAGRDIEIDDGKDDQHLAHLRRIGELQRGLDRDELVPFFQAEWDLSTGRIVGAEALVRWLHPTDGLLGAYEVVSLAESSRMVAKVGRSVLRSATSLAREWLQIEPGFLLRVNVSAQQLRNEQFAVEVAEVLEETGYPATSLCLELTESMLLDDPTRSGEQFSRLRALGVGLAIDDFGTGYSSILQLKELPITSLKIDQRFVAGLADDPSDRAIVEATLELARAFGVSTTAEGVETDAQREVLRTLGCRRAQGFLLSKPEPADDFGLRLTAVASQQNQ